MDNCLAPAWAQSLPDLLAAHRINGIWAGNWGVAARVSRHVPWDRTAIRAYCTVHPQALYTAAYAHDLAGAGRDTACSHAGSGCRTISVPGLRRLDPRSAPAGPSPHRSGQGPRAGSHGIVWCRHPMIMPLSCKFQSTGRTCSQPACQQAGRTCYYNEPTLRHPEWVIPCPRSSSQSPPKTITWTPCASTWSQCSAASTRTSCATREPLYRFLAQGTPLHVVSEVLGHASIAIMAAQIMSRSGAWSTSGPRRWVPHRPGHDRLGSDSG